MLSAVAFKSAQGLGKTDNWGGSCHPECGASGKGRVLWRHLNVCWGPYINKGVRDRLVQEVPRKLCPIEGSKWDKELRFNPFCQKPGCKMIWNIGSQDYLWRVLQISNGKWKTWLLSVTNESTAFLCRLETYSTRGLWLGIHRVILQNLDMDGVLGGVGTPWESSYQFLIPVASDAKLYW